MASAQCQSVRDSRGRGGDVRAVDHKRKGQGMLAGVGKERQSFHTGRGRIEPKRRTVILRSWAELETDPG